MAKARVYEVAKDLGLSTKEMLALLRNLGISVKSHMSILEEAQINEVRKRVVPSREQGRTEPSRSPAEAAKPGGAVASTTAGQPLGETQKERKKTSPPQPVIGTKERGAGAGTSGPAVAGQTRLPEGKGSGSMLAPAVAGPAKQEQRRSGPALVPGASAGADGRGQERAVQREARNHGPGEAVTDRRAPSHEARAGRQGRPGYGAGQSQPGQGRPGQARPNRSQPGRFDAAGKSQQGPGHFGHNQGYAVTGRPGALAQPNRGAAAPAPAKGGGGEGRSKSTGRYGKDDYEKRRPVEVVKAKRVDFRLDSYNDEEEWAEPEAIVRRPVSKKKKNKGKGGSQPVPLQPVVKKITIGETVVVQDLAQKLAKPGAEVVKKLVAMGVMASLTQEIDAETATLVANEFGTEVEVKIDRPTKLEDLPDAPESMRERPPVVTVMGHVDHGKTSLLDAIRKTNVTATEAGGITQHIGAYQVQVGDKKITFLDTPGHEAFTAMRARGAEVTDIAVLVVAADDGVMPQTVEAIAHARAAGVPIIVAINKIDRPDANPERVKQQLTEHGLVPEEWGGDTVFVNVSATKGIGIDELLEMILLVAEMSELKANPDRPARGTVIEAELDRGRGPVATVLVQKGTLRVGDSLVAGAVAGKVRAMFDFRGERLEAAGPSTPVQVLGLDDVPEAGDIVQVTPDEKVAREISMARQEAKRKETLAKNKVVSLDEFFKNIKASETKELPVIVKADVQGSLEAVTQALARLGTDEVKVNVIHGGVGAVTETDVMLASTAGAIIIGFNVRADSGARKAAEAEKVDVRLYRIIYELIDDIRKAMSGLLEPEEREVILGRAEVRQTFKVPRVGVVAGSYVTEGKMVNRARVRVIRDGVVVYEGQVRSLKRFKDDVREVAQGYECGIGVENFNDVKEGDVLEAYTIEKIKREL